jgi:hypothetical protein
MGKGSFGSGFGFGSRLVRSRVLLQGWLSAILGLNLSLLTESLKFGLWSLEYRHGVLFIGYIIAHDIQLATSTNSVFPMHLIPIS